MDDFDRFLSEDLGKEGDITSNAIFSNEITEAAIISKESCILAGLEESEQVFKRLGLKIELKCKDGDYIKKEKIVAKIKGSVKNILKGERLALNFLCRMSGIASETNKLVKKCRKINPNISIAATRKTTPGFRKYEKKAVVIGGGETHRNGLFDQIMIKDNHIKALGSIGKAIKKIKEKDIKKLIEVEIENEKDAITAAKLNVDVIMIDNLNLKSSEEISKKIRKINRDILIEISGGINNKNIIKYAKFADRISIGYLTHSIKSKNFSLEIL